MINTPVLARLKRKLQSYRGETMVETLVSVLISALALMLLATAIGTSVNIVKTSRINMTDYYKNESDAVNDSQDTSSSPDQEGVVLESQVPLSNDPIKVDVYNEGTITYYIRSTP